MHKGTFRLTVGLCPLAYIISIIPNMIYNPFSTSPPGSKPTPFKSRLQGISVSTLSPLEWTGANKRPHSDTRPSHATQESVRVVEKVVQKVVHAEPTTILGIPPLVDDRVRFVVNFILDHVNSPNVEIEAKLGLLIEREHNVRAVSLVPVMCETPIAPASNKDTRFESNITREIFVALNAKLNKRVEETAGPEKKAHEKVVYTRTKEVDVYYPGRVRETCVQNQAGEYETIRVQRKKRLGDLNVLCPTRSIDIRYSASSEEDASLPEGCESQMRRVKDRISYKYGAIRVDMTCVSMHERGDETMTYEVEVEVDASAELFEQVEKYRRGDDSSRLFDIATSLVNTVRILMEE